MKFTKLMVTVGALAVTGLLATACSSADTNGDAGTAGDVVTIKVAASATPMTDAVKAAAEAIEEGYKVELIETTAVIGGRVTLRARAWLLQTSDTVEIAGHHFDPMPEPESLSRRSSLLDWPGGLVASIDGVSSDDNVPGRGQTWVTSPYDLVDGEHSMPLAEYAKLLDTSNGVAVRESPNEWMFPNVELSLHFFREPRGRWVGFDTRVAFGAEGIGLTSSVMHDLDGPVGTINQSLTLRRLEG